MTSFVEQPVFCQDLVYQLKATIKSHIDKAVEVELLKAKESLEKSLRDTLAKVSLQLFNQISFESRGHEFVLKVNIDDRR